MSTNSNKKRALCDLSNICCVRGDNKNSSNIGGFRGGNKNSGIQEANKNERAEKKKCRKKINDDGKKRTSLKSTFNAAAEKADAKLGNYDIITIDDSEYDDFFSKNLKSESNAATGKASNDDFNTIDDSDCDDVVPKNLKVKSNAATGRDAAKSDDDSLFSNDDKSDSDYDYELDFFLGEKESAPLNEDEFIQNDGKLVVINMDIKQCHESVEEAFSYEGDVDINTIINVAMIAEKNDELYSEIKEKAIDHILLIGHENREHNEMALSLVELIENTDWSAAKTDGHVMCVALCPTPEKGVDSPSINYADKSTYERMRKQDIPPTGRAFDDMVEHLHEAARSFHNPRWTCRTKCCGKRCLPTDDEEAKASSLLLFTFATFLRFIGVEPSIVNIGGAGTKKFWNSMKQLTDNFNPFRTIVASGVHLSMTTYYFALGYKSVPKQINKVTAAIEKMAMALDQPKMLSNLLNSEVACMVCKDVISDEECKALAKASLSRKMSYIGSLGGKKVHSKKNAEGKSAHNEKLHSNKNPAGQSVHAVEMCNALHSNKNPAGQSAHAVGMGKASHKKKNAAGQSVRAVGMAKAAHKKNNDRQMEASNGVTFDVKLSCEHIRKQVPLTKLFKLKKDKSGKNGIEIRATTCLICKARSRREPTTSYDKQKIIEHLMKL